jgi:hypothetical protein
MLRVWCNDGEGVSGDMCAPFPMRQRNLNILNIHTRTSSYKFYKRTFFKFFKFFSAYRYCYDQFTRSNAEFGSQDMVALRMAQRGLRYPRRDQDISRSPDRKIG